MLASHATRVAKYAEKILTEEGGNPAVAISAAYLNSIGIKEAEKKHKSADARYQEEEGPPIARDILKKLKAKEGLIEEVCDIIGHHHGPNSEESINFKIVYDAEQIVNLEDGKKESDLENDALSKTIDEAILTKGGRKLASKMLLNK